jgi:hypothetical protein
MRHVKISSFKLIIIGFFTLTLSHYAVAQLQNPFSPAPKNTTSAASEQIISGFIPTAAILPESVVGNGLSPEGLPLIQSITVRKHSDLPANWKRQRATLTQSLDGRNKTSHKAALKPIAEGYAQHAKGKGLKQPVDSFGAVISQTSGGKIAAIKWASAYAVTYQFATPVAVNSKLAAVLTGALYRHPDVEGVALDYVPRVMTPIAETSQKSSSTTLNVGIKKLQTLLSIKNIKQSLLETYNDPLLPAQWEMWGPSDNSDPNFAFAGGNVVNTWRVTQGSPNAPLFLYDAGFVQHEDLEGQWAHDVCAASYSSAIAAETTLLTNCRNGLYTDSFVTHGLWVASTAAAKANNGKGGVGVAPGAKLFGMAGYSNQSLGVPNSIRYAAGLPYAGRAPLPITARVWSSSLGLGSTGAKCDSFSQEAIDDAFAAGLLVVVAAGNENGDQPYGFSTCRRVIPVTGMTRSGNIPNLGWAHGAWVALAAPGTDMTGATPVNAYKPIGGTSFSAPMVAGTIALMLAANPNLTAAQTRSYLLSSTRPFGTSTTCNKQICGAGMLDALQAVKMAQAAIAPIADAQFRHNLTKGELDGRSSTSAQGSNLEYKWRQLAGTLVELSNADTAFATFNWNGNLGEDLLFELTVTDSLNNLSNIARTHTLYPRDDGASNSALKAIASFSPQWPKGGDVVSLDGRQSTNSNNTSIGYKWIIWGGSNAPIANANSAQASFVMPRDDSSLFINLVITDPATGVESAPGQVYVYGFDRKPPTVVLTHTPQRPKPGETVILDASQSRTQYGNPMGSVDWFPPLIPSGSPGSIGIPLVMTRIDSMRASFVMPAASLLNQSQAELSSNASIQYTNQFAGISSTHSISAIEKIVPLLLTTSYACRDGATTEPWYYYCTITVTDSLGRDTYVRNQASFGSAGYQAVGWQRVSPGITKTTIALTRPPRNIRTAHLEGYVLNSQSETSEAFGISVPALGVR